MKIEKARREFESKIQRQKLESSRSCKLRESLLNQIDQLNVDSVCALQNAVDAASNDANPEVLEAVQMAQSAIDNLVQTLLFDLETAVKETGSSADELVPRLLGKVDTLTTSGYPFAKDSLIKIENIRYESIKKKILRELEQLDASSLGAFTVLLKQEGDKKRFWRKDWGDLLEQAEMAIVELTEIIIHNVRSACEDNGHTDHFLNVQKAMQAVTSAIEDGYDFPNRYQKEIERGKAKMELLEEEWYARQSLYHSFTKTKLVRILSQEELSDQAMCILQASLAILGYRRDAMNSWFSVKSILDSKGNSSIKRIWEKFSTSQVSPESLAEAKASLQCVENPIAASFGIGLLHLFYTWSSSVVVQLDEEWAKKHLPLQKPKATEKKTETAATKSRRVRKRLRGAARKATALI